MLVLAGVELILLTVATIHAEHSVDNTERVILIAEQGLHIPKAFLCFSCSHTGEGPGEV